MNVNDRLTPNISCVMFLGFPNSTLSDYAQARHTRREAGIQYHGWQLKPVHGAWIPAIHAGMTNLENSNYVI